MKLFWQPKLLSFYILLVSIQINAQNTISVKKSSTAIDAIFQSSDNETKQKQYYCFKKSGYVYYFASASKEKKIIKNCQGKNWLKLNSSVGKYFYYQHSIKISPITFSVHGEETTNDFHYAATLQNTELNISPFGKKHKQKFHLLFPIP